MSEKKVFNNWQEVIVDFFENRISYSLNFLKQENIFLIKMVDIEKLQKILRIKKNGILSN